MTKANIGKHSGAVLNRLTFAEAYAHVTANPGAVYLTTGNQTHFTLEARQTRKGAKAIIVMPNRYYVYECCWGHKTNGSGTHIDCYTLAI
jgi:hypothetical protein